jgi:hypothetical protein
LDGFSAGGGLWSIGLSLVEFGLIISWIASVSIVSKSFGLRSSEGYDRKVITEMSGGGVLLGESGLDVDWVCSEVFSEFMSKSGSGGSFRLSGGHELK